MSRRFAIVERIAPQRRHDRSRYSAAQADRAHSSATGNACDLRRKHFETRTLCVCGDACPGGRRLCGSLDPSVEQCACDPCGRSRIQLGDSIARTNEDARQRECRRRGDVPNAATRWSFVRLSQGPRTARHGGDPERAHDVRCASA